MLGGRSQSKRRTGQTGSGGLSGRLRTATRPPLWSKKRFLFFWILIFSITIFFSLKTSIFIWEQISLLKLFQFPWRLTGLLGFSACAIAAFVFANIKNKKILFMFFILILVCSLPFVRLKRIQAKNDNFYLNYPGTTYYHGQGTTIWISGDAASFPPAPLEIIDGKTTITNLQRISQKHTFLIVGDKTKIVDNTVYFPGWKVFIDGKEEKIQFQDINHKGLITFLVPQGRHVVEVAFQESKVRFFSDTISFIMFLVICIQMGRYTLGKIKR